jgi:hypothetical protein
MKSLVIPSRKDGLLGTADTSRHTSVVYIKGVIFCSDFQSINRFIYLEDVVGLSAYPLLAVLITCISKENQQRTE